MLDDLFGGQRLFSATVDRHQGGAVDVTDPASVTAGFAQVIRTWGGVDCVIVNAGIAVVLLAHQPIAIHEAARLGVDLQLSGHTHGGQIWPWGALVRLQQPFIRGHHRVGNCQLYISCGTGFWGPPMRLGAPAEITEIILRSGQKQT